MIIFGGWVANTDKTTLNCRNKMNNPQKAVVPPINPKDYVATNGLACFDIGKWQLFGCCN